MTQLLRGTRHLRGIVPIVAALVLSSLPPSRTLAQSPAQRSAVRRRPTEGRNNTGPYTPPQAGRFAGRLTHALASYTGPELKQMLANVAWFGFNRDRACLKRDSCAAAGDSASLTIQAIVDANRIRVSKAPAGGFGTIIGRVMNRGDYADLTTRIAGGQKYPDEYYYVVIPTGKDTAELQIAVLTYDQANGSVNHDLIVGRGLHGIFACPRHASQRRFPLGDFATCDMTSPSDTLEGPGRPPALRKGAQLTGTTAISEATPWFSCAEGCCSAQAPPYTIVSQLRHGPAKGRHHRKPASRRGD